MKLVLASCNPGKVKEFLGFYKDLPIEIIPQESLSIPDVEETGLSFIENAILKARNASKASGLPAISDDSGLMVDALKGAPGIYSARYAPTDEERIQKLLNALKDVPEEKRTARLHSTIAYLNHAEDPKPLFFEGELEGRILFEPKERRGHTYEPIFYITEYDCVISELDLDEKLKISHRGKAMQQLYDFLKAKA